MIFATSGTIYRRETPSGSSSWVAHATWQEGCKRRQSKRSFRTNHSSVSFTLDTYGRVMPGQQAEAAAATAALINRPS